MNLDFMLTRIDAVEDKVRTLGADQKKIYSVLHAEQQRLDKAIHEILVEQSLINRRIKDIKHEMTPETQRTRIKRTRKNNDAEKKLAGITPPAS